MHLRAAARRDTDTMALGGHVYSALLDSERATDTTALGGHVYSALLDSEH